MAQPTSQGHSRWHKVPSKQAALVPLTPPHLAGHLHERGWPGRLRQLGTWLFRGAWWPWRRCRAKRVRARPAPRGGGRSLRDRLGCKWRGRELPPLPVVPERQPPPHRGAAPAGPRPAPAHWLRAPGAASGRSRRRPPSVLCLSLARRPPAFVCPHIAFTARALPPPGANLLCRSWRRDDGGDRIADLGRRRVQPAIDTQGSSGADLQKWPGPLLPRFTR